MTTISARAAEPPAPFGPLPTERHLRWHEMEYYGFIHFTVNTFTDKEWGYGDESPEIFNPTDLDPRQWAEVAREGRHEGPDPHGQAPRRLLPLAEQVHRALGEELALEGRQGRRGGRAGRRLQGTTACGWASTFRPGTATMPTTARPKYIDYYRNQLRELLTNYGDIFEVWFDGANGGDGYYGGARETRRIDRATYYDWPNTWKIVRELQPMAVMFSDGGPDIRWVGNESGAGSETNWATLRRAEFAPGHCRPQALWLKGQRDGTHWVPAEVDVSIRPGWFYHASQDDRGQDARPTAGHLLQQRGQRLQPAAEHPARPPRPVPRDRLRTAHGTAARSSTRPSTKTSPGARRSPPPNVRGDDPQFSGRQADRRRPQHLLGGRR